jgi:LysM repeat protein
MKLKKALILKIFIILTFNIVAQGIYIPKSNVIEEKNGKTYYVHTVTKGQTVYSIAKTYDVTIDEIYYENPDSRNGIKIGEKLWIPTINKETQISTERSEAKFDYFYHITGDNETFEKLSKIYNIPQKYIRLANPDLTEPFKYGEYVKIPIEESFAILDGKKPYTKNETEITYQTDTEIKDYKNTTSNININNNTNSNEGTSKFSKNVSFNPKVKIIEDYRHVVVKGETLEEIANKYKINVKDLKLVNPGLTSIRQGERLRLPEYAKIPGVNNYTYKTKSSLQKSSPQNKKQQNQTSKYFKYTVKNGDNVFKLSRKFGVSLDEIFDANPTIYNNNLTPGKVLLIPKVKKRPHYVFFNVPYKMKLKKVADFYGISKNIIKEDNPELKNKLLPGQTVKIRGGEKAVLLSSNYDYDNLEDATESGKYTPESIHKKEKCKPTLYNGKKYKIALMVPLFLEEIDSLDFNTFLSSYQSNFKPFWFIKFLEGALIAVDSLKQQGYNLDIYIYDIDDQVTKTIKILQRPELKNMNLIIGPFYSKSFDQVALFAENFNIPIVNPFTFREEMLTQYSNLIKVKPGKDYQIPLLGKLLKDHYQNYKVFVISQNSYYDAGFVYKIKNEVNENIPLNVFIPNYQINNLSIEVMKRYTEKNDNKEGQISYDYTLEGKTINPKAISGYLFDSTMFNNQYVYINYFTDSIHPIENLASPIRKNLVILYGDNKSFLMDALNKLNVLRDTFDIEVIGMPYWEMIKRPDYQILNNLKTTYFSSYYINYENENIADFENKFKKSFNTVPDKYGFAGFDIVWFFVKNLADYGKNFNKCLPYRESLMFENGFKFNKVSEQRNNFENEMWNILKIDDYKVIRLPESNIIPVD